MTTTTEDGPAPRCYVHQEDVPWGDYSAWYPAAMLQHVRAKRLMGPRGALPCDDMVVGVLELDPGASYPKHCHEAPETHYVIQGGAEYQFGEERFTARLGTAIYTAPNLAHSFRNAGTEKFVAVAFWWAPGGDRVTLSCDLVLL